MQRRKQNLKGRDALAASEQHIKQLFDSLPVAVAVVSESGEKIETINEKFTRLFGYTVADLPDVAHWWLLAYPDEYYREEIKSRWQAGLKPMQATVTCKDGSQRYVEFQLASVGAKRLITFVDLTERKHVESELQQSNDLLRAVIEAAPTAIIGLDLEGKVQLVWNTAAERMLGWSAREVMGKFLPTVSIEKEEEFRQFREWIRSGRTMNGVEVKRQKRDGTAMDYSIYASPLHGPEGKIIGNIAVLADITEKKQAQEALRVSDERYRTLFTHASDAIFLEKEDDAILDVNPAACTLMGYSREELLAMHVSDLQAPELRGQPGKVIRNELFQYGNIPFESVNLRRDGTRVAVEVSNSQMGDSGLFLSVVRDITERKRAEQEHLAHLKFFEHMDQVNRAIQGTNDLEQMMSDVLDAVLSMFACDRAYLMYPCDPEAAVWRVPMERNRPEYPGVFTLGLEMPMTQGIATALQLLLESNGPVKLGVGNPYPQPAEVAERFDIKSSMLMALYPRLGKPWQFGIHQCAYERIWTNEEERLFQEIGRRISDALTSLLAYRNLQESEERYRTLVELSPDGIGVYEQGKIVFVNSALMRLSGATEPADLLGKPVLDFVHPEYREVVQKRMRALTRATQPLPFLEEKFLRLDGSPIDVEVTSVPITRGGTTQIQIVVRDITERKRHELEREAVIAVSNALRKATTRMEILTVLLDQLVDLFEADGSMVVLPDPAGGFVVETGRGKVGQRFTGLHIPIGQDINHWVIDNKQPYLKNGVDTDTRFYRADLLNGSPCVAAVPLIAKEHAIGVLWIIRRVTLTEQDLRLFNAIADIAANALHRVTLHEQTELQLHHLSALRQIDRAISANFDLNVTFKVILNNLKNELKVDAASILLLNPVEHTLDYAAGIGFRTSDIEQSHVKLEAEGAGRAAREYRTISYPDLALRREIFNRASLLAKEGFLSYYASPLLVKGQVKGVLELFHRTTLAQEREWMSYFETLATQATIAIESASLFENLQRSNLELVLAYDATIEGWSRALDLRDRETEGHTQRVTEMVLKLAEKTGMSDKEKVDLRRGALLHDIGKMGVPDSILLKPGSLSESEWGVMRQHPSYAYQMLSPISYLRHALEIPYCHHERWDGSGYPRGLRREEIPLGARLFAVVDVFDALTSARPYRLAWSLDTAHRYIQEQSGKLFDPGIGKIFLESR